MCPWLAADGSPEALRVRPRGTPQTHYEVGFLTAIEPCSHLPCSSTSSDFPLFNLKAFLEGQGSPSPCSLPHFTGKLRQRFQTACPSSHVAGGRIKDVPWPPPKGHPVSFKRSLSQAVTAVCTCQGLLQKSQNRLGCTITFLVHKIQGSSRVGHFDF